MAATFVYLGHPAVGAHVRRCLEEAGFVPAESPELADVAVTYFAPLPVLEDAYFGDEALVELLAPDALAVDLSPATPGTARDLAAVATVHGLHFVEAPLAVADPLAADPFARRADITCFAAGSEGGLAHAHDVLDALAGTVWQAGGVGAGELCKAVHTAQAAACLLAGFEADALLAAVAGGPAAPEGFRGTPAALAPLAGAALAIAGKDGEEGTFAAELFMAEVAAALYTAEDEGLVLPQLEVALRMVEMLMVAAGPDRSLAALRYLYRSDQESAAAGFDWERAEEVLGVAAGPDHAHAHGDGDLDDWDAAWDEDWDLEGGEDEDWDDLQDEDGAGF